MTVISKNFASIGEYIAEVCNPTIKIKKGLECTSHDTGREDFFWTEGFGDAARIAAFGWKAGADRVIARRDSLQPWLQAAKTAKIRQHSYDVVGDYVDVGRYLTGEPECWGTEVDSDCGSVSGRVVSIRLNQAVSGSVDAESIAARGVTVLLAVDLLESCGTRVEVVLGKGSVARGTSHGSRRNIQVDANVVVKNAGDPVDLDRLAFWIAHPASFRRLGFRLNEQNGISPRDGVPTRLSDHGQRDGVVEIDEVCTAEGLSDDALVANVLAIAAACGLEFDEQTLAEICG